MKNYSQKTFISIILTFSLLFSFSVIVCAQDSFAVGEVSTNAGEKKNGFIIVPAFNDEPEIKIPITVINGEKDGPVLALIAGVHGYEYPPILAMQRVGKKLEPSGLSGAVIIVHVANVPSFLRRTIYYNPYDWKNLNRVFPGKVDGTNTERIAYHITKEVIDRCDYLIDNHCGDGNEDLTTYLYCTELGDPELDRKTRELAVNYGFKIIVHETNRPRDRAASVYCANTALLRGKPAITIESGKVGRTDEEDVIAIVKGTYNTLVHLNMIEGKIESFDEPIWVQRLEILRSDYTGLFYPLVKRGEHVEKNELLGYVTDFFGNVLQKVKAPYSGMVMYVIATPPMNEGEPLVSVGGF